MGETNDTAAAVLGFLHLGPMTGWQISEIVQVALCDYFNVTRSQVYRELRSLASGGLVEAREKGARDSQPYAITPAGREAFRTWLEEEPGPALIRSPFHLRLLFADHLDDDALTRFVRRERAHTLERLAYYRRLTGIVEGPAAHVLRFGIASREAELEWLDALPWNGETVDDGAEEG